jgi:hypothetical protein
LNIQLTRPVSNFLLQTHLFISLHFLSHGTFCNNHSITQRYINMRFH